MEPFTTLEAPAIPVDQPNIDTDQIIPARFLGRPRPDQAKHLFNDLRYDSGGKPRPEFIMNRPGYEGARIVVAERNFACGSSRETAVTVMVDNGLKAFIAPSFGDIFFNNCFQNGILPVALPIEDVEQLADEMRASPGNARVTVDLENCEVVSPTGRVIPFKVDARRQHALLNGLDDIAQTMTHKDKVEAWQAADRSARPWVWL